MTESLREVLAKDMADNWPNGDQWIELNERKKEWWRKDADRAIVLIFNHLEKVTPEMRRVGAGRMAVNEVTFLKMLAVARKAALP